MQKIVYIELEARELVTEEEVYYRNKVKDKTQFIEQDQERVHLCL